ncbi:MAG: DUF1588 domain-containing protein [Myxococcota bacterium]
MGAWGLLALAACGDGGPTADVAGATDATGTIDATTTGATDASGTSDATGVGDAVSDAGDATGATSEPDVVVGDVDYSIPTAPAPAVRRLGARELARTYAAVVGVVPEALGQVPPDPRDFTFDRMVNAQTVSGIHAEAYDAAAREAADTLLGERRLDDLTPACGDAILPPATLASTSTTAGIGLAAYPDWALLPGDGNPDRLLIRYAPDCGGSLAVAAPEDGTYHMVLDVELIDTFDVSLTIDGDEVSTWSLKGQQLITYDAVLTAGPHLVGWDFHFTAGGNPYVWIQSLAITGPVDVGATRDASARAACVDALIDTVGPRAFRRPLSSAERTRLADLHAAALADGGTWGEATRLVLRAILGSPKFLYLVEIGTPVDGAPGHFALDDWAIAARLSYALCEGPPDDTLAAAAAAGELRDGAAVRAQAERLMAAPCAEDTLLLFYRQWLWLERLPQTAKDPAVYPDFSSAVALAQADDADQYLRALTFESAADVAALYLTPRPAAGDPPELDRHGLMMLPGVLTVTGKFSQTSPVIRGKYVLEQLLCDDLPSPPITVDTTPPPLDPNLTSRERWAAHSEADSCRPCHERIDPIGFTFEEFDAMGRSRASENGQPIDDSGSAPVLGITDDSLHGVGDLAAAVASSDRATSCLARQWLRFALGRLEEEPDAQAVAEVAAALKGPSGSLRQGFIALTGTTAFRQRIERQEAP